MTLVLLLHTGVTLFLCGLIWTVQLVHYPLFARVGSDSFTGYEQEHQKRISRIVAPAMLLELGTALALLVRQPEALPRWAPSAGLTLIAAIWMSTALGAVPQHRRLSSGFSESALGRLLRANWQRTAAWSLRGILVLYMVLVALEQ
jgi:hypothetical protein